MNRTVRNMILGMIPMTKDSDNQHMKNLMLSLVLTGLFIVLKNLFNY